MSTTQFMKPTHSTSSKETGCKAAQAGNGLPRVVQCCTRTGQVSGLSSRQLQIARDEVSETLGTEEEAAEGS